MNSPELSDDLRRFIYSIQSIPHLEAILLLHQNPLMLWQPALLAQRLYTQVEVAKTILIDLAAAGIAECKATSEYQFNPLSHTLSELIDQLAVYYAHHLIDVTHMIHSRTNKGNRVRQFADAFKFQSKDER